jgi:hypothetical protein
LYVRNPTSHPLGRAKAAAVTPADHFPDPSRRSVATGILTMGPTPEAKSSFAVNVRALEAIHVATAEILAAEAEASRWNSGPTMTARPPRRCRAGWPCLETDPHESPPPLS